MTQGYTSDRSDVLSFTGDLVVESFGGVSPHDSDPREYPFLVGRTAALEER